MVTAKKIIRYCLIACTIFCTTLFADDFNNTAVKPTVLSLHDAIFLAVRTNPNVESSQLSYLSQKFNLWVQQWMFYPHYTLQAGINETRVGALGQPFYNTQNTGVQPGVTLQTPIGTQIAVTSTNTENGHYNPGLSAQISQPLMRGFGTAVVEAALANAKDSEVIARLSVENVLRSTVTAVINAYLDVVSAERSIAIDDDALKRAQQSVQQTKLFIKAGHKAGNELVTVEANVATAKTQVENDKNNLTQARYALLTAIGVDPNTTVNFSSLNIEKLIAKYELLPLPVVKKLILENDIQYQVDLITLHGSTCRNVMVAKDNARWQLNLTGTASTGNSSGGGQNAGLNSLFNGVNQGQSIGLTLQVPIDDQLSKQAVMNAKIALRQAELSLMQEKWSKETSVINGWNSVINAKHALQFARDAEKLQARTYNISYQKYLHGLIDSLELQTAQVQLISSQQVELAAEIAYLKALVGLDLLIGNTLKTWDVKVRV